MTIPYEIVLIEQIVDRLAEWAKKPDPDSHSAFVKWKAEIEQTMRSKASQKALKWVEEHNPGDESVNTLVNKKILIIIRRLGTIASNYEGRDELFAKIAGKVAGLRAISLERSFGKEIDDLDKDLCAVKQDILDVENILRNKAQIPRNPTKTEQEFDVAKSLEGYLGKIQETNEKYERLLAISFSCEENPVFGIISAEKG